jgi:hypothetical protein
MKALINPNEQARYISGWTSDEQPQPIYTTIGARVCQVEQQDFPVGPPMFWMECGSEVVADVYYYDTQDNEIKLKPEDAEGPVILKPSQE